jgi:hypothetical protein
MSLSGPYVNPNGPEFFFIRGEAPWPTVLKEAASWARQMGDWDSVLGYDGISDDIRISDEHEWVHWDDESCAEHQDTTVDDPNFVPCCRTVSGYQFRVTERA